MRTRYEDKGDMLESAERMEGLSEMDFAADSSETTTTTTTRKGAEESKERPGERRMGLYKPMASLQLRCDGV